MKFKLLLLSTALLSSLAFAAPSEQSLAKLAQVMPYESLFFETVITPIGEERTALAYSLSNDTTLSDTQRKDALKAFDDYAQKYIALFDNPATKSTLKKSYTDAARKHFSQDEVDAQIAFYGSEQGKRALEKSNQVYDEYMQTLAKDLQGKIESYQKANLTKMQDKVKQILKK